MTSELPRDEQQRIGGPSAVDGVLKASYARACEELAMTLDRGAREWMHGSSGATENAGTPGKRSQTDRLSAPAGSERISSSDRPSTALSGTAWLDGVLGFANGTTSDHSGECNCAGCAAGRAAPRGDGEDPVTVPVNEVKKQGADTSGTEPAAAEAPSTTAPATPPAPTIPGQAPPQTAPSQATQSGKQPVPAPVSTPPRTGTAPTGDAAAAPPPPPPTLTSKTRKTATGGADVRTTIAVGEVVEFTGSASGTWTATGGTPAAGAASTTFIWTAPGAPGSVTITLTVGTQAVTKVMTVIAPSSIAMVLSSQHGLTAGTAGVCMVTNVTVGPATVSFGNVQWLEVPGPATNVAGYFTKFSAATLHHNPNPNWLTWNDSNTGLTDHAAWHSVPGPYTPGTFQWDVPNKYRVAGSGAAGTEFTTTHQLFAMTDNAGTMTVSKGGASVARTP
jgi:hypothetical protein